MRTLIAALIVAFSSFATADLVVYSTLAPSETWDSSHGYGVPPPNQFFPTGVSVRFSPSATGLLTSIDAAIGSNSSQMDVVMNLYGPSGTQRGALLASAETMSTLNLLRFDFSAKGVTLDQGSTYTLRATSTDVGDKWFYNDNGYAGAITLGTVVTSGTFPAYDVVEAVPEPANLFGLGLGVIAFARKSKRSR